MLGPPAEIQNTDDETVDEVEDEVYSLISRLRQLVGDIDSQPILDQLRTKLDKEKATKVSEEEPPKALRIETDDRSAGKPKQNTRFTLPSPLIIKEKAVWEERPDSPIASAGPAEGPFQRPSLSSTSRYSLGQNRFSLRAQEISADTLNYVNGSKLLRNTTRSAMMTPDPYAFISPVAADTAKKHFSFNMSAKSSSITPPSKTSTQTTNFAEFCVIGVENDMLVGLKSLENSSLQPTEVIDLYPGEASRAAIVGNLNEYCFPYGAELKYMTHKDLENLKAISQVPSTAKPGTSFHNSSNAFGLQFQIMQFTDVHSVVYYATCVISPEPLEHVCPTLQANMHNLLNLIAASNTIKRYLAYFVHRKKQALNEELNAEWQHNLEKARDLGITGRAGGTKSVVSSITFGSSTDSKSMNKPKSFFRSLKKAIGGLRSGTGSLLGGSTESVKGVSNLNSTGGTDTGSEKGSPHQSMFKTFRQGSGSTLNSPLVSPLVRQRSLSHDSPALARAGSKNSSVEAVSHVGAAQVHVDGSPAKASKLLQGKLHRSNKRVALVTQRAYCIISDKPMHALFFQILESIALKERERALARWSSLPTFSTKDASPNGSGSSSPVTPASPKEKSLPSQNRLRNPPLLGLFRDPSTKFSTNSNSAHLTKRNEFLSYIQNYDFSRILTTMYSKRAVSVPRNSVKFIDLSFGGYMKSIKISYKALMLKEWTVAILIALLPSELIVKILSQLLQEQSLLVYGSDAGMVTAVVSAFTLLLQPFSWEGIHVPLLPMAAYEALDAPVPFVIGVVASSRPAVPISSSAGVLSLNDFIHHPEQYVPSCFDETTMRHTMASRDEKHLRDTRFRRNFIYPEDGSNGEVDLGLKFFEAPCPDESHQGIVPLLDPMQCSQLKELHQFIAYHAVKIRASLKFAQTPRAAAFNSTCAIKSVMNDLSDE
eukprot:gene20059-22797_t